MFTYKGDTNNANGVTDMTNAQTAAFTRWAIKYQGRAAYAADEARRQRDVYHNMDAAAHWQSEAAWYSKLAGEYLDKLI